MVGHLLSDLMSQLPYDHPANVLQIYRNSARKNIWFYSKFFAIKLGKFDSKEMANLTSTDTINFEEIGSKKTAVYVISSDTHTAYDFLLTIFFSQMIQQLYDYADSKWR